MAPDRDRSSYAKAPEDKSGIGNENVPAVPLLFPAAVLLLFCLEEGAGGVACTERSRGVFKI